MNKEEIISRLIESHKEFTDYIASLDESDFMFTIGGKWTPGQQADHIRRSIRPVRLAFSLPKQLLKLFFGRSNRPSKTIEALNMKYKNKLAQGGKASSPFIPKEIPYNKRDAICSSILKMNNALAATVGRCSEESLDVYILPHPLFGKITLREMLYFNIIHVRHHFNSINQLLSCKHK